MATPAKHLPDCDTQDRNPEGIVKPCNCKGRECVPGTFSVNPLLAPPAKAKRKTSVPRLTLLERIRFELVKAYAPTGMLGAGQQPAPVCARLTISLADETLRQLYATPFSFEPVRDDGLMETGGR
jgi:hypothetical protein